MLEGAKHSQTNEEARSYENAIKHFEKLSKEKQAHGSLEESFVVYKHTKVELLSDMH